MNITKRSNDNNCAKRHKIDNEESICIPIKKLECSVCLQVLSYPVELKQCGCVFCLDCAISCFAQTMLTIPLDIHTHSLYPSELSFSTLKCPVCRISGDCTPYVAANMCLTNITNDDTKVHECKYCHLSFELRQYTTHVLACVGNQELKCSYCNEYIAQNQQQSDSLVLLWHYHLNNNCKSVTCNKCNWIGDSQSWSLHLTQHVLEDKMNQFANKLKGNEKILWQKYCQDMFMKMPIERFKLSYAYV